MLEIIIKGEPGEGKSTLAAYIANTLRRYTDKVSLSDTGTNGNVAPDLARASNLSQRVSRVCSSAEQIHITTESTCDTAVCGAAVATKPQNEDDPNEFDDEIAFSTFIVKEFGDDWAGTPLRLSLNRLLRLVKRMAELPDAKALAIATQAIGPFRTTGKVFSYNQLVALWNTVKAAEAAQPPRPVAATTVKNISKFCTLMYDMFPTWKPELPMIFTLGDLLRFADTTGVKRLGRMMKIAAILPAYDQGWQEMTADELYKFWWQCREHAG